MPLPMSQSFTLIHRISEMFQGIGTDKTETALPSVPSDHKPLANNELVAYEYLVAQFLYKMASKRLERAEADAVDHGVLIDKKTQAKEPGFDEDIYSGSLIAVHLGVKNGASLINEAMLKTSLALNGVKQHVIDKIIGESKKKNAASHSFTARFKRNNE